VMSSHMLSFRPTSTSTRRIMPSRARNRNGELVSLKNGSWLRASTLTRPSRSFHFRNETFHIESSATNATVKVYDRKTIGKDKEIGEAQLEVCFSGSSARRRVERVRI
jgi:hypothetical protein